MGCDRWVCDLLAPGAEHSVELSDQSEPSNELPRFTYAVAQVASDLVLGNAHINGDVQSLVAHRPSICRRPAPRTVGPP